MMKKISFFTFALLILVSCGSGPTFNVTGNVSGAEGKKLYLEASQLNGVVVIDSVKLKEDGAFRFKQPRPESPEFFRLRVENKAINFSVDSTETVTIQASLADFTTGYTIEGSPNSLKIKELTLKQIKLQNEINELGKLQQSKQIRSSVLQDSLFTLLSAYKDDVRVNYIYAAPNTTAAYFALYQTVNGSLIFDPLSNKDDVRSFAAVATSMEASYPEANRTKNLRNLTLKGMKNTRTPKEKAIELSADQIKEATLIDIELKDLKGNVRRLTDLKGKVVLLDFTAYQTAASSTHNFWLNDLYDMYKEKGLEIYQVSFDSNEHFWKTSADNLPWICVRDPNGIYSTVANIYNLQQLPTYFLISRDNELKVRSETIKDIHKEIKALL